MKVVYKTKTQVFRRDMCWCTENRRNAKEDKPWRRRRRRSRKKKELKGRKKEEEEEKEEKGGRII